MRFTLMYNHIFFLVKLSGLCLGGLITFLATKAWSHKEKPPSATISLFTVILNQREHHGRRSIWKPNRSECAERSINKIREEIGKELSDKSKWSTCWSRYSCRRHVLIEGVPGVAKTLTAKLLSKVIDVSFTHSIYSRLNALQMY